MLTRAGSNEVVGSQDEFYFAFKDFIKYGSRIIAFQTTLEIAKVKDFFERTKNHDYHKSYSLSLS
jgi:hypothetical protein